MMCTLIHQIKVNRNSFIESHTFKEQRLLVTLWNIYISTYTYIHIGYVYINIHRDFRLCVYKAVVVTWDSTSDRCTCVYVFLQRKLIIVLHFKCTSPLSESVSSDEWNKECLFSGETA
jgi:hypothetical protein